MIKKDALKKTWKVLSAVASVIVLYRQSVMMVEASQMAQEYLKENVDIKTYTNPVAAGFTQKDRVGSGV